MCLQTDRVFQDTHEVHTRLAAHETQLGTLRTLLDSREEQLKKMSDKVERGGDWESKLEDLRQAVQSESKGSISQQERLELLLRRVEHQDTQVDELRGAHERLSQWQRSSAAASGLEAEASVGNHGLLQDLQANMQEVEGRVATFTEDLQQMRAEMTFGPKVSSLVKQLQDIVPKVVDHDKRIREFTEQRAQQAPGVGSERVDALEAHVRDLSDGLSSLKNSSDPVQQISLDELRGLVKETSDSLKACSGDLASLQTEVQNLKTSNSERGSQESAQAVQTGLEQKQKELEALISQEVADIKSSIAALSKDQAVRMEKEIEGATALLHEGLARVRDQSESAEQNAKGTAAELAAFKTECSAQASALSDLEAIKNNISELKGLTGMSGELEVIKSDVSTLKSQSSSLSDLGEIKADLSELKSLKDLSGLPIDFENVKSDLAALRRSQGASAELLEALRGDVNTLKRLEDVGDDLASLKTDVTELKSNKSIDNELSSLKSEIAALKSREGIDDEIASLKSDITELRSREGVDTELAGLKSEIAEIKGRAGIENDLASLKSELAELQSREGDNNELASLKKDVDELKSAEGVDKELASLKSEIAELKSREGTNDDFASLRNEIAELKGREGVDQELARLKGREGASEELASLKGEIAELKSREGADTELASLRNEIAELKGREGVDQELARLKGREGASEELASLKGEIAELKSREGADTELASLRNEIAELKGREGVDQELASLKKDVDELKSREGANDELASLKGEIAEIKSRGAAGDELAVIKSDILELKSLCGDEELSSLKRGQQDVVGLRSEVTALCAKVEALALSAGGVAGENGAQLQQLAELALAVKQDDAAEEGAHKQLLSRIDELCERLAEVDAVVANLGSGSSADRAASEPQGDDPEFKKKFESLVKQVEAMTSVERQIQAKFDGFVSQFTQASTTS